MRDIESGYLKKEKYFSRKFTGFRVSHVCIQPHPQSAIKFAEFQPAHGFLVNEVRYQRQAF